MNESFKINLDWLEQSQRDEMCEVAKLFALDTDSDECTAAVIGSKEDILRFLNRCFGSIDDATAYFNSHVPSNEPELKAQVKDACVGERTYLVRAASESEAEQKIKNELEKPSRQIKEIKGLITYFESHKIEDFNSLMSRLKEILK